MFSKGISECKNLDVFSFSWIVNDMYQHSYNLCGCTEKVGDAVTHFFKVYLNHLTNYYSLLIITLKYMRETINLIRRFE